MRRTLATCARAVKHGLAIAAGASGALDALRAARRLTGPHVHVYGYHRVLPDPASISGATIGPLCVSTRSFAAHLDHLARRYEVWPLDRALELLAGEGAAPARDVAVITFDDGYHDVLDHAAPLLAARGLPATVFVTTGSVGTGRPLPHDRIFALVRRAREARVRILEAVAPDRLTWPLARADFALQAHDAVAAADALLGALPMDDLDLVAAALAARIGEPEPAEMARLLTWDDLGRLAELRITAGAHGVTHTHLPNEDDAHLAEELAASRATIAERLGAAPSVFSYPAGRYDERTVEAARAAGYRAAVTTEDRRNHAGADPFRIGRKIMCEEHGVGVGGRPVAALAAAQLDGLFSSLGLSRAVPGDRGLGTPWQ